MPLEAFREQLKTWNECIRSRKDPEFGAKIFEDAEVNETGPFLVSRLWPRAHHTMGGLIINTKAQVLNAFGEPIPGLWAAGEATGGVHGEVRLGTVAIADCIVFGRIRHHRNSAIADACGAETASTLPELSKPHADYRMGFNILNRPTENNHKVEGVELELMSEPAAGCEKMAKENGRKRVKRIRPFGLGSVASLAVGGIGGLRRFPGIRLRLRRRVPCRGRLRGS